MSKVILFMAGGTGGHVFPALAVAKEMAEKGYAIHWLGTEAGIEKELVSAVGYPLHYIDIAGLRGKGWIDLLTAPLRIIKAVIQARRVVKKIKPAAALGMGGYATGPGGIAVKSLGIPLLIHEQNAYAGVTNKLLNRISDISMQAFPGTLVGALVTGNPVRVDIQKTKNQISDAGKPLKILVVGGSLGAVALNKVVLQAMGSLDKDQLPQLWHQVGKRNIDNLQQQYQQQGIKAKVTAFIDDMAAAYEWADLVVCRAGALTVSEVAAAGKAAIFVPFPFAVDDHQTANANYLADKQAAIICQQTDLTADWLVSQWQYFSNNRTTLQAMADKARQLAIPNATNRVVEHIERLSCEP